MTDSTKRSEIPHELRGKLASFDSALNSVENGFQPLLNVPQIELNATLSTLDKAKLDLVAAYSINSLFWMYLNVSGVNPKDHGIKQELERIRSYMSRVKEIQDRENAPQLDKKVASRFVKSALWDAAQKGKPVDGQGTSQEDTPGRGKEKGKKRKSDERTPHKGKHTSSSKKKRYMQID